MYLIYASRASSSVSIDAVVPFQCFTRDDAAKRCIELYREGYTIRKIVPPSGVEVHRDFIEPALKDGLSSIKAALGS